MPDHMGHMVSVKLTKKQAEGVVSPSKSETPEYPYGMRITLEDDLLKKLGIGTLPAVGKKGHIMANCYVANVSSNESEGGGKRRSLELQITDLGFEYDKPSGDAEKKLYGG